jgi:hypothetical protein
MVIRVLLKRWTPWGYAIYSFKYIYTGFQFPLICCPSMSYEVICLSKWVDCLIHVWTNKSLSKWVDCLIHVWTNKSLSKWVDCLIHFWTDKSYSSSLIFIVWIVSNLNCKIARDFYSFLSIQASCALSCLIQLDFASVSFQAHKLKKIAILGLIFKIML